MNPKIRVHGKSQSRTALGIINAYLKLFPDATPSQVKEAFPKSLNRRCTVYDIIVPIKDTVGNEKVFFEREDEQIVFNNGERYALIETWIKDDFISICEHAKQYGIEAAKEGTKPFEKGSFEMEFLDVEKIALGNIVGEKVEEKNADANVEAPAVAQDNDKTNDNDKKKCKCKCWWWILLLILLLLLMFFLCKKCHCNKDKCEKPDDVAVENVTDALADADTDLTDNDSEAPEASAENLISDDGNSISLTLPDGSVLNIDKNSQEYKLFSFLNSDAQVDADRTKGWLNLDKVKFESGKSKILSESENQLKNVAQILQAFPNSHLKVGGYTDNIGGDATNMKISGERAKVTADKLISLGVAANRINHEGYGPKHPVCPANDTEECRATNRRIDVRVTKK